MPAVPACCYASTTSHIQPASTGHPSATERVCAARVLPGVSNGGHGLGMFQRDCCPQLAVGLAATHAPEDTVDVVLATCCICAKESNRGPIVPRRPAHNVASASPPRIAPRVREDLYLLSREAVQSVPLCADGDQHMPTLWHHRLPQAELL